MKNLKQLQYPVAEDGDSFKMAKVALKLQKLWLQKFAFASETDVPSNNKSKLSYKFRSTISWRVSFVHLSSSTKDISALENHWKLNRTAIMYNNSNFLNIYSKIIYITNSIWEYY